MGQTRNSVRLGALVAGGILLGSSVLTPIDAFAAGAGTGDKTFYDYLASQADKDTVIDFNEAPATGEQVDETYGVPISDIGGLYILQETKDDDKPVYFYRGNVTDNNVILNDMCWLIVRTTETGGTKLLYNGTPTDGQCLGDPDWSLEKINSFNPDDASTWPGTIADVSQFNAGYNSPSDMYYMYGERYETTSKSFSNTTVFGNDVTYANGVYTLQDTVTGGSNAYNGHHYTCLTTGTTCSEVYYENYRGSATNTNGYFLTFTGGDTLETALAKMAANEHDSVAKTAVENWYAEHMTDAAEYLEDTIFYGSKTFASGSLSTKDADFGSNFDQCGYSYTDTTIDTFYHGASREKDSSLNDSTNMMNAVNFDYTDQGGIYTVANGTLKYPVGLLSTTEMIMAGNGYPAYAKGTYIDDNFVWWGVSPIVFGSDYAVAGVFFGDFGDARGRAAYHALGVRPVVSLKSTLGAFDGDGSRENPFTALAEVTESEDEEMAPEETPETPVNPATSDSVVAVMAAAAVVVVGGSIVARRGLRRR
ncbi:hypothetical protein IJ102_01540 [Candidatus Saccharibacteria bacterium]|nr:hypothetical protein [Candidatus Saccharibacteria bacterium]